MDSKICRVCLDKSGTLSLFDEGQGGKYCDKIMKCADVRVEQGDGFPDAICVDCSRDLLVTYEFIHKCEASDKALRSIAQLQLAQLADEPVEPEVKEESLLEDISNYDCDKFIEPQYSDQDIKPEVEEEKEVISIVCRSNKNNRSTKKENNIKKHKSIGKIKKHGKPLALHKRMAKMFTGRIQCPTCGLVVACHSAYQNHMRSHTKEKPFMCDICKKCYRNKYSLKRHIINHYNYLKIAKKPLKEDDGRRNKTKAPPIPCVVCGLTLLCKSALDIHMRSHTGERPFACEVCGKSYTLKGTLVRHMVRHSDNPKSRPKFVCEHCGKTFFSRTNIIVHMRVHTGEKPYQCPYCELRFRQVSCLIRHKRKHTGEKPFICSTCGKAFIERSLLNKHQSVHSDERKFSCHLCRKTFKTKYTLKMHIVHHNKTATSICNICGKEFNFKGNLNTHMKKRHSEKSGFCTICSKMCTDIDVHMRVHNGEKPFGCKMCDMAYTTKNGLTHHINFRHRDSAKFKCTTDECNRAFPTMSMLEFHVLKQHLDSSPYVCRHCDRSFLRPSDLSRHLKMLHLDTHTTVKSQFIKTIKLND